MALRSAALSGRKELLSWLNNLCNSTYPSVESLRDGAAYCTVVEAAISRIAQNCTATHSPDAPIATSRAEQARTYLSKVDWSATAFVCESGDASNDPMAIRAACSHNMQLLQDMLHDCVPIEHRYTAEASRLASGKLQDHVLLLRWLYLFMSKVLAHYSRKALEKKGEAVVGAVEGVKLNRTALLRSHQINGSSPRGAHAAAQARESDTASQPLPDLQHSEATRGPASGASRGSTSSSPPPPSQAPYPRMAERDLELDNVARDSPSSKEFVERSDGARSFATPRPGVTSGPPAAVAVNTAEEALREKVVHSHYTRGTIAIPEHLRDTLVSLRNEVEEVEDITLYVQEQHNFYLTRPASGTGTYTPSATVRSVDNEAQYRLDVRDTFSLEELGELLEERDALAQQYAALDAIVTRALQQSRARGTAVSPLLRDVVDLLHPA